MPTTTLAMIPICELVFMKRLASQPTIPPTISAVISCMLPSVGDRSPGQPAQLVLSQGAPLLDTEALGPLAGEVALQVEMDGGGRQHGEDGTERRQRHVL